MVSARSFRTSVILILPSTAQPMWNWNIDGTGKTSFVSFSTSLAFINPSRRTVYNLRAYTDAILSADELATYQHTDEAIGCRRVEKEPWKRKNIKD